MLPLLLLQLAPSVPRHAVLIDVSRLEEAEPSSVAVLAQFLAGRAAAIHERVTRAAVVRPRGVLGMLVAGFPQVIDVRCPVHMFEELAAAAASVDAADLTAELDAAMSDAKRATATLVRLRQWLDDNVAYATLEHAARATARAPRSLQRDLHVARSSFQDELQAARLRRAKRLLATTEHSVTEIAYHVGCASPQHFSVLFRKRLGMPPSAWRALHRARQ